MESLLLQPFQHLSHPHSHPSETKRSSLLLCVHQNGSSNIFFSPAGANDYKHDSAAVCPPPVPPAGSALQFNKGLLLPWELPAKANIPPVKNWTDTSSWGCHQRGGAWLGKSPASGTPKARRTHPPLCCWWEPGRKEVQKAANNRVEVYVKIGLCSTPIDFQSLKHNYQRVICSTTDATLGFGPGGNCLTVSWVSQLWEHTGIEQTLVQTTHFSLCYVSERQLWWKKLK